MNENPVRAEFLAVAEKCRARNKEDRVDYMLSALRDAAQDLENAGFRVTLEVRPKLLNSAISQSDARANAVLCVDNTSFDCVVWTENNYRTIRGGQSECIQDTSLKVRAAAQDLATFTTSRSVYGNDTGWRDPLFAGKPSLKDALVSLMLKAKAEQEIYGEYDFGAQPLTTLAKPLIPAAGLRQNKEGRGP